MSVSLFDGRGIHFPCFNPQSILLTVSFVGLTSNEDVHFFEGSLLLQENDNTNKKKSNLIYNFEFIHDLIFIKVIK